MFTRIWQVIRSNVRDAFDAKGPAFAARCHNSNAVAAGTEDFRSISFWRWLRIPTV